MSFTDQQIAQLSGKLDPAAVRPPQKFGPKGDYLEGWYVIAEANRIFGFDGWSYESLDVRCVSEAPRKIGRDQKDGWGVTYTARVRVVVHGIVREDCGAGHGYDLDVGLAHESALKEAVTDALKRTLRTFGNPFGLALYDKTRANVGVTEPATEPQKPTSAAEMKRGLEQIDQDLVDCHTIGDVDKCAKIWAAIMKRDGWSKDYIDCAKPKFAARRDAINNAGSVDDIFPGDAKTNSYAQSVMAG